MSISVTAKIKHKITLANLEVINVETRLPREDNEYFSLFMPIKTAENLEVNRSNILYILTEFITE